MHPHALTYFELNPVEREPSPVRIALGAAYALLTLWVCTVFLFSL